MDHTSTLIDEYAVTDGQAAPSSVAYAPEWIASGSPYRAPPPLLSHAAFDRLMARVPAEIRRTFTSQQMLALSRASVPINSPYRVNVRTSVPFFGKRFYVTLLMGRERRSLSRLADEKQLLSARLASIDKRLVPLMLTMAVFALVLTVYVFKSGLGIDFAASDAPLLDLMSISEHKHFD